ncbi:unnamed protein product [Cylindrotheca closterium]|uniref:RING-type domain-containing protein n=1 Tax=Cylindrotheca closterium TaxID=2856 RepID=A0AAD2FYA6_9STRA|nr:unnamed protein product [Cylindrotheca closterium]
MAEEAPPLPPGGPPGFEMFLASYARAHARLARRNPSFCLKCPVCNFEHREVTGQQTGNFQPPTQNACSHGCRVVFMKMECPICIESQDPPVVAFPCGHGVCKPCFERLGGRTGEASNRARGRNLERTMMDRGLGSFYEEDDDGFLRRVRAARPSFGNRANHLAGDDAGSNPLEIGQRRLGLVGDQEYHERMYYQRLIESSRASREDRAIPAPGGNDNPGIPSARFLIRPPYARRYRRLQRLEALEAYRANRGALDAYRANSATANGENPNQDNAGSNPSADNPGNQDSNPGNNPSGSERGSGSRTRSRPLSPESHSRADRIVRARRAFRAQAEEMRARPIFSHREQESTWEDSYPGIRSPRMVQARRLAMNEFLRSHGHNTVGLDPYIAARPILNPPGSSRPLQASNASTRNVTFQNQGSSESNDDESSESSSDSSDDLVFMPPDRRPANISNSGAAEAEANRENEEGGGFSFEGILPITRIHPRRRGPIPHRRPNRRPGNMSNPGPDEAEADHGDEEDGDFSGEVALQIRRIHPTRSSFRRPVPRRMSHRRPIDVSNPEPNETESDNGDEQAGDEEMNEENEGSDDEEDVVLDFLRRQRERRVSVRNRILSRRYADIENDASSRFRGISNAELVRRAEMVRRQTGRDNGGGSGAHLLSVARHLRENSRTASNNNTMGAHGQAGPPAVPLPIDNRNNDNDDGSEDDSDYIQRASVAARPPTSSEDSPNRTVRNNDSDEDSSRNFAA